MPRDAGSRAGTTITACLWLSRLGALPPLPAAARQPPPATRWWPVTGTQAGTVTAAALWVSALWLASTARPRFALLNRSLDFESVAMHRDWQFEVQAPAGAAPGAKSGAVGESATRYLTVGFGGPARGQARELWRLLTRTTVSTSDSEFRVRGTMLRQNCSGSVTVTGTGHGPWPTDGFRSCRGPGPGARTAGFAGGPARPRPGVPSHRGGNGPNHRDCTTVNSFARRRELEACQWRCSSRLRGASGAKRSESGSSLRAWAESESLTTAPWSGPVTVPPMKFTGKSRGTFKNHITDNNKNWAKRFRSFKAISVIQKAIGKSHLFIILLSLWLTSHRQVALQETRTKIVLALARMQGYSAVQAELWTDWNFTGILKICTARPLRNGSGEMMCSFWDTKHIDFIWQSSSSWWWKCLRMLFPATQWIHISLKEFTLGGMKPWRSGYEVVDWVFNTRLTNIEVGLFYNHFF